MKVKYSHKDRKKRYSIAHQEISKAISSEKVEEIIVQIQDKKFTRNERALKKHLITVFSSLLKRVDKVEYRSFIRSLRYSLLHLDQKEERDYLLDDCYQTLLKICYFQFSDIHLYHYGLELVNNLITSGYRKKHSKIPVIDSQKICFSLSYQEQAKWILKLKPFFSLKAKIRDFRAKLNTHFDSHTYNLPFLLYTLKFYQGIL
jgi:hypothetical protein